MSIIVQSEDLCFVAVDSIHYICDEHFRYEMRGECDFNTKVFYSYPKVIH